MGKDCLEVNILSFLCLEKENEANHDIIMKNRIKIFNWIVMILLCVGLSLIIKVFL